MDWLTFLERIIEHLISWPVVVALCFLVFRRKLGEALSRIISILLPGGGGIRFTELSQQSASSVSQPQQSDLEKTNNLPYYLRVSADIEPYFQITEEAISRDLDTVPTEQRNQVLIRNLAAEKFRAAFEYTYTMIFGSQLRILAKALQAGKTGLSLDELRTDYEEMLKAARRTELDYSMSSFISFLTNNRLIELGDDSRYRVTAIGRAFLRYLHSQGRSLSKAL